LDGFTDGTATSHWFAMEDGYLNNVVYSIWLQ